MLAEAKMMKNIVRVGLSAATLSGTMIAGIPGGASADSKDGCSPNWRGDTVCISATGGEVSAHARDQHPNATVYLSIHHVDNGAVVAGPAAARTIRADLPPGRYYANYYVADVNSGDAQVSSAIVQV